jgi:hypothetical protein
MSIKNIFVSGRSGYFVYSKLNLDDYFEGNIIPLGNHIHDIGSANNQWDDIFVKTVHYQHLDPAINTQRKGYFGVLTDSNQIITATNSIIDLNPINSFYNNCWTATPLNNSIVCNFTSSYLIENEAVVSSIAPSTINISLYQNNISQNNSGIQQYIPGGQLKHIPHFWKIL